jgi:hypothetical protein
MVAVAAAVVVGVLLLRGCEGRGELGWGSKILGI